MKISSLMVALIVVGMIMIMFATTIGTLNNNYSTSVNQTELDDFNQIAQITNLTSQTKEKVDDISDNPSFVDKLSSFFNSGIIALKTTFLSFDLVNDIIDKGMTKIGLGTYATALKSMFLVLIIIGVAIAAIVKWRT